MNGGCSGPKKQTTSRLGGRARTVVRDALADDYERDGGGARIHRLRVWQFVVALGNLERTVNVVGTLDALAEIRSALRGLAPRHVVAGACLVETGDEDALFPEERAAVGRAVASRRRQFAAGRALLRELLGQDVPIPVGSDRRPVLPAPYVASLAHDSEFAVAVATRDRRIAALGIDIEPVAAVTADLTAHILRPDDELTDAASAFVVKEAAYKAWSRPDRPILDHHDVRITADAAAIVATVLPTGDSFPVHAALVAGRWLAVAVVATPESQPPTWHSSAPHRC
jgi:4'-phosphopantetheinyl transferase EntD